MTGEVRNPVRWEDIEPDMTEAEKQFAKCLAHGKPCVLGDAVPAAEASDTRNTVRSEVIRFFAYGGDEGHQAGGGTIELQGAWIPDELDLNYLRCHYALKFFRCRFARKVMMRQTECRALYLENSTLDREFQGDGLATSDGVFMRYGFKACKKVRLRDARIGGDWSCTGGTFKNPKGAAINAERIQTNGHVFLNMSVLAHANEPSRFSAVGEVRLQGARIGGDLNCSGGVFKKPEGGTNAIVADHIKVRRVFFGNFSVSGQVRMRDARISGDFICKGEKENASEKSSLDLSSATAGCIESDRRSWHPFDEIHLDGFTYGRFGNNLRDPDLCLKWLGKQSRDGGFFAPHPYEQAAKVLFEMGHNNEARKILLRKEQESTKHGRWEWWHRPLRWLWNVCAGYGYALRRTTLWSVAFILVGTGIFWYADRYHRIVPSQAIVQTDSSYRHAVKFHGAKPTEVVPKMFPGHTGFTPLAYSLDVFIPFFVLHQEPAWSPDSGDTANVWKPSFLLALAVIILALGAFLAEWTQRRCEKLGRFVFAIMPIPILAIGIHFRDWLFADWWWLTVWYWLEIGAGWVLTSLFLLSVTGLLRPRQSGEKG